MSNIDQCTWNLLKIGLRSHNMLLILHLFCTEPATVIATKDKSGVEISDELKKDFKPSCK